jgi:hypothetical protein
LIGKSQESKKNLLASFEQESFDTDIKNKIQVHLDKKVTPKDVKKEANDYHSDDEI